MGHQRARDLRTRPMRRAHTFTIKLYPSEVRELRRLAAAQNRTPGDQLRAVLHAAIRAYQKTRTWIPDELHEPEKEEP